MKTLLITVILFAFISSCQEDPKELLISGRTMGTSYSIRYFANNKTEDKVKLKASIDTILVDINQEMSTYIKTSELSTFNSSKSTDWVKSSQNLFHVINYALIVAKETKGVFDPTIGPLVNLWGFGPNGQRKVPTTQQIEKARKRVGYKSLLVDSKNKKIKKLKTDIYVDLSASAKGFGVDAVAGLLNHYQVKNYMVEIGGEVITKGNKGDRSWRIAIEAPNPENQNRPYQKVLNISGMGLATSGDYRNFFMQNGKKYSHTINFKTGKPVDHTLASVSVAHESSCMKADAWATALLALGPIKGMELAKKLNLAAYFIYKLKGDDKFIAKGTSRFNEIFK